MKGTEDFKKTIKAYLDNKANEDNLFAVTYANKEKNIDDCITYICNTVIESGCVGFTDDEVFSMAIHYWDEKNIEVGRVSNLRVVVNHVVELTEEEQQLARIKAIDKLQDEAYLNLKKKGTKGKKVENKQQLNLF